MMVILQAGGFAHGGINFDAKLRRNSTDAEDLFIAHISGMDAFARAALAAEKLLAESPLPRTKKQRYASFDQGVGAAFAQGRLRLRICTPSPPRKTNPRPSAENKNCMKAFFSVIADLQNPPPPHEKMFCLLTAAIAAVLAGCAKSGQPANPGAAAPHKITIGLSLDTLKEARWQSDRDYFIERAKQLGADVLVLSANSDDTRQVEDVQSLDQPRRRRACDRAAQRRSHDPRRADGKGLEDSRYFLRPPHQKLRPRSLY